MLFSLLGIALWSLLNRPADSVVAPDTAAADATTEAALAVPSAPAAEIRPGNANYCRAAPRFTTQLGFAPGQSLIGTSLRGFTGLTLSEPVEGGRVYQDPTWDDAGYLGAWVYDRSGNIFTAPAPFVSLSANLPELQNRIYKVDTDSGKMALLADMPPAKPPTEQNPFGVLGLFYDCDTNSLYAGSVAGSTVTEVVGRILRIDPASGAILDSYEGVDAMGVGVYNHADGKRLYFGTGRDTGVYSLPLDEQGDFAGEPRLEFYLAQFEEGGNEKAQRITFTATGEMVVKGVEFNYNLRAASTQVVAQYQFVYNTAEQRWDFSSVERTVAN